MLAAEAESKEKHDVWDPKPELTIYPPLMFIPGSTPTHLAWTIGCSDFDFFSHFEV